MLATVCGSAGSVCHHGCAVASFPRSKRRFGRPWWFFAGSERHPACHPEPPKAATLAPALSAQLQAQVRISLSRQKSSCLLCASSRTGRYAQPCKPLSRRTRSSPAPHLRCAAGAGVSPPFRPTLSPRARNGLQDDMRRTLLQMSSRARAADKESRCGHDRHHPFPDSVSRSSARPRGPSTLD
jgi:hypothetical protein